MIRDSQQGFEFSRQSFLLSWAFLQDSKKSMKLLEDLWNLNNMKGITVNYVDSIPFSCIDSFHIVHNRAK